MNERIRRKNKERDERLRRRIGIIKKREILINEREKRVEEKKKKEKRKQRDKVKERDKKDVRFPYGARGIAWYPIGGRWAQLTPRDPHPRAIHPSMILLP
jgi:hypothetical protein